MTHKNHISGDQYTAEYNAVKKSLPGAEINWLNDLRQQSITTFSKIGLPGPKVEEWKYSNLNFLNSSEYDFLPKDTFENQQMAALCKQASLNDIKGEKVVFCNGYYQKELSNISEIDGVALKNLNQYLNEKTDGIQMVTELYKTENSLNALNAALMSDGVVLIIKQGIKLAEPIQIIHITTEAASAKALRKRNFIHLEKHSSAQIIEHYIGADHVDCWNHNVTRIKLDEGAALEIFEFQMEGDEAVHMNDTAIEMDANVNFRHHSLNLGSRLSRTEIKPTLNGINGRVELRGAFLSGSENAHDVFTHMKHMAPECGSDQNYRGVLAAGGRTAFQGKVYVAKDAQLTNADQSNKNLILDRNAQANSKPELLIYADDVKCSHGATVGELDGEALFYLKSRGLDQGAAKALLVEAFIAEVFEDITLEPVREKYLALARHWLEEGE